MVIFGASGDLTKRKLVPALYSLARDRLLPARFAVVGYARKPIADDAFRDDMREGCDEFARRRPVDAELWDTFASHVFYQEGSYDDPAAYAALKKRLEEIEAQLGPAGQPRLLPVDPAVVVRDGRQATRRLGPHARPRTAASRASSSRSPSAPISRRRRRSTATSTRRSPRSRSTASITTSGKRPSRTSSSSASRTASSSRVWNNRFVDHVQITGAETVGVEGRGGYFEHAGILRDMVQNHLFQVVSLAVDGAARRRWTPTPCATRSSRC